MRQAINDGLEKRIMVRQVKHLNNLIKQVQHKDHAPYLR